MSDLKLDPVTLNLVATWLRTPEAMAHFSGLSECTYTTAVLPSELAEAITGDRRDGPAGFATWAKTMNVALGYENVCVDAPT